jgi:hypothetical protein
MTRFSPLGVHHSETIFTFPVGCAQADGYVHDAQCLVYRGPDTKYNGRDICYGYNEDTLTM